MLPQAVFWSMASFSSRRDLRAAEAAWEWFLLYTSGCFTV